MLVFKILFYAGFAIALISSIVKIIGRHKTGYCAWGEPELDIIQIVALIIGIVGMMFC